MAGNDGFELVLEQAFNVSPDLVQDTKSSGNFRVFCSICKFIPFRAVLANTGDWTQGVDPCGHVFCEVGSW